MESEIAAEVGSWVSIRDGALEESWRIAAPFEADARRRWISDQSPLGQALVGHRAGERVQVGGVEARTVVIVDITPPPPGSQRLRLVLVSEANAPIHALWPGRTSGPSMCGIEQPVNDWTLLGFSSTAARIDCESCRAQAVACGASAL